MGYRFEDWLYRDTHRCAECPEDGSPCPAARPPQREVASALVFGWQHVVASGSWGWLLVHGPRSTGKTFLGVAALRKLKQTSSRIKIGYVDCKLAVRDLQLYIEDRDLPDPFRKVRNADAAVIDGLSKNNTGFLVHEVTDILNERWANQRPTLVISGDPPQKLRRSYDEVAAFSHIPALLLDQPR